MRVERNGGYARISVVGCTFVEGHAVLDSTVVAWIRPFGRTSAETAPRRGGAEEAEGEGKKKEGE